MSFVLNSKSVALFQATVLGLLLSLTQFIPSHAQQVVNCAPDVVLIGVRGSTQTAAEGLPPNATYYGEPRPGFYGFGRPAADIASTSEIRLHDSGLIVDTLSINYPASLTGYWSSSTTGKIILKSILTEYISCPGDGPIIMMTGFSQGAHVIRQALTELDYSYGSSLDDQIAAIVNVADPLFSQNDIGELEGTWRFGEGLIGGAIGWGDEPYPSRYHDELYQLCNRDDNVCDRTVSTSHADYTAWQLAEGGRWAANKVLGSVPWTHTTTPVGDIVKQSGDPITSWLVGADGYRRWIPTGGDYLCFVAEGATVHDGLSSQALSFVPDLPGQEAICTPSNAETYDDQPVGVPYKFLGGFIEAPWNGVAPGSEYKGDRLDRGEFLERGEYIASDNLRAVMSFQNDGNLVIAADNRVIWASATEGLDGDKVIYQGDGNFVMYDGNNPIWDPRELPANSFPAGQSDYQQSTTTAELVIQNDGNVVAYNDAAHSSYWWHSHTAGTVTQPTNIGDANMSANTQLDPGEYIHNLDSDTPHALLLQADGNLVLYSAGYEVEWETGTDSYTNVTRAKMQSDGNFVIYNTSSWVWQSGTGGHSGDGLFLRLGGDGNLVIYEPTSPTTAHWARTWNNGIYK